MPLKFFATAILLLFLFTPLLAENNVQFLAASEFYHMHRLRETGTFQKGRIDGVRLILQRQKANKFYLAADCLYAGGTLRGEDARARIIRSELTDLTFEARLGYCLQRAVCQAPFFIPFGGWGYFKETNNLTHPSPFPFQSTDQFDYMVFGFLSGFDLFPCLNIGLNFKTMFMRGATSTIVDPDPEREVITLMIKDVPYFRLELPCTLHVCGTWLLSDFRLSPFYEYRHFGGREGYPYNFVDTTFNLFGLTTTLIFTY